eukprot:3544706-Rhodomonas_salina.1
MAPSGHPGLPGRADRTGRRRGDMLARDRTVHHERGANARTRCGRGYCEADCSPTGDNDSG